MVSVMARVALLTDDIWVENEVRAALTDPGTVIEVTSDPVTIVDFVARTQAGVAVIDLQVQWMGGMAVVRELRSAVENGHIPPVRTVLLLDRRAGFLPGGPRRLLRGEAVHRPAATRGGLSACWRLTPTTLPLTRDVAQFGAQRSGR